MRRNFVIISVGALRVILSFWLSSHCSMVPISHKHQKVSSWGQKHRYTLTFAPVVTCMFSSLVHIFIFLWFKLGEFLSTPRDFTLIWWLFPPFSRPYIFLATDGASFAVYYPVRTDWITQSKGCVDTCRYSFGWRQLCLSAHLNLWFRDVCSSDYI